MDISDLSKTDFNAVQWINERYKAYIDEMKTSSEQENKRNDMNDDEKAIEFLSIYLSKLQLHTQQVKYSISETCRDIVSNMPRIVQESQLLQANLKQIREQIVEMRQDFVVVQDDTGDCMEKLEYLNDIKLKLQTAKESLQESDGWGNLMVSLEDSFEKNDLMDICDKIVTLEKSLQAQEQLSGHSERQSQVEDFKNRLEALASSYVVQSFASCNVSEAAKYVSIFNAIQRRSQLLQYYRAVQKTTLQQRWKQILDLQQIDGTIPQTRFLTEFYEELLQNCQQQVKWCSQVFKEADNHEQPFLVMIELLPVLQPTRDQYIQQLFKTCNERLQLLEQFARDNETFVSQLNAYLDQQITIKLSSELKEKLSFAIFEYYHKFIQQYPRLEETYLSAQMDSIMVIQTNPSDSIRHLRDIENKLFQWLLEAINRCSRISGDSVLYKFIKVLAGICKRLLEQFSKTQRQFTLNIGHYTGQSPAIQHESNWSLLQHTLSLLECLADFQQKLQNFEETLYEHLRMLQQKLLAIKQEPTVINFYQSLDVTEQQNLLSNIDEFQRQHLEINHDKQFISLGIFTAIYNTLKTHFSETHDIVLNILLKPLETHLSHMQPPYKLEQNHLEPHISTFSFAPQECITQIGQYLLTLPQHLEPLLLTPSTQLKYALEMSNIRYSQAIPSVDVLLNLVVAQCCITYQSEILHMKNLSDISARQLIVDIEYLSSVLEELGLNLSTGLTQILTLLKASPENYATLSIGCEPLLVSAIRQMRNINIITKE